MKLFDLLSDWSHWEQAESIVRSCKYPSQKWPRSIRGAGVMFVPAAFYQSDREYLTHANGNIIVIDQIESRAAIENCEAIAGVDGIG